MGKRTKKMQKLVEKQDLEKLGAFLNDKDEETRIECIQLMVGMQNEKCAMVLTSLLIDPSAKIRLEAVKGMHTLKNPNTRQHLQRRLPHETDALVIEELQKALHDIPVRV